MFPGSPCLRHSCFHSLPEHLSFKLRHRSQHLKCEPPSRQRRINILLQRHQIYTHRLAFFRDAQQLLQRSRQPIQRPDHNHINLASSQIIHHGGQGWSVILGATLTFIPVDNTTPAAPFAVFLQFVFLQIGFLLDRGYPHVNRCSLQLVHHLAPPHAFWPSVFPALPIATLPRSWRSRSVAWPKTSSSGPWLTFGPSQKNILTVFCRSRYYILSCSTAKHEYRP